MNAALLSALTTALFAATGHYTSNEVGTPYSVVVYTTDLTLKVDDSVCPQARIGTDLTYDPINFARLRVTSLQPCTLVPLFRNGFEH